MTGRGFNYEVDGQIVRDRRDVAGSIQPLRRVALRTDFRQVAFHEDQIVVGAVRELDRVARVTFLFKIKGTIEVNRPPLPANTLSST